MKEHIIAAEYANPEHTELVYVTANDGVHRIIRDENPSFWHLVHQRAVLKTYVAGGALQARAPKPKSSPMIDVTPKLLAESVPSRVDETMLAALRGRIAELEDKVRSMAEIEMFAETEVAAEYAVLVMAPDGAVEPERKRIAEEFLAREAQARGVDVTTLCRTLGAARDERNQRIMSRRLDRLGGNH